jgi:hypothetical protein
MKRILSIAAAIALSATAFAPLQASAQIHVSIVVPVSPPPLVVEVVPPPRPAYIWAPGYWRWDGHRHVWSEGHWENAREGERYERPEWRRDGDKWRFQEGGWKKAKKDKKHKKHKGHGDHDDNDHDDGHFCPPGQAKKGNC